MPSRDPVTGQFTSSDSSDRHGMENFEVQAIQSNHELDGDIGGGEYVGTPINEFEPAGGLERGELAELVAVIVDSVSLDSEPEDEADAPNHIEARYLLTDDAYSSWFEDGAKMLSSESGTSEDIQSMGNSFWESTDERSVWSFVGSGNATWDNDVDGAGGGPGQSFSHGYTIPYRQLAGEGYIFDRHDSLFEHIELTKVSKLTTAGTDFTAEFDSRYRLIWNVFDDD